MPPKRKKGQKKRCAPCYRMKLGACDARINPDCTARKIDAATSNTPSPATAVGGGSSIAQDTDHRPTCDASPSRYNTRSHALSTARDSPRADMTPSVENTTYTIDVTTDGAVTFNVANKCISNVNFNAGASSPDVTNSSTSTYHSRKRATTAPRRDSLYDMYHPPSGWAFVPHINTTGKEPILEGRLWEFDPDRLPSDEDYPYNSPVNGNSETGELVGRDTENLPADGVAASGSSIQDANLRMLNGALSNIRPAPFRVPSPDTSSLSTVLEMSTPHFNASSAEPATELGSSIGTGPNYTPPNRLSPETTENGLLARNNSIRDVSRENSTNLENDPIRDVATLTDDVLTGFNQPLSLSQSGMSALIERMRRDPATAEIALLEVMDEYRFDPSWLKEKIADARLDVAFAKVNWARMVSRTGLQCTDDDRGLPTFKLERGRVPNNVFHEIVRDINNLTKQYGFKPDSPGVEAASMLTQGYLNSIVAMFGGLISNTPSAMFGPWGETGRTVHQFSTYGQVHLLFIQVTKEGSGQNEKLDLFAHAMAECDAFSWQNAQKKDVDEAEQPIMAILSDGTCLYFFELSRAPTPNQPRAPPTFRLGRFTDGSTQLDLKVTAPDDIGAVIENTRLICDVLYWIFLRQFDHCVRAYVDRQIERARQGSAEQWTSTPVFEWLDAKARVGGALESAMIAMGAHRLGNIEHAGRLASNSYLKLREGMKRAPKYQPAVMDGYNEEMANL